MVPAFDVGQAVDGCADRPPRPEGQALLYRGRDSTMETPDAFAGFGCSDCEEVHGTDRMHHTCPACCGRLTLNYDREELERAHERLFVADGTGPSPAGLAQSTTGLARSSAGLARFASILPISADRLVTLGETGTPLLEWSTLLPDAGPTVYMKDEGRQATGSLADREMALAVTAAREGGAESIVLPTTGHGGHAAATYAARAGLDATCFVPSRAHFAIKAMINVHGGSMSVVEGRYPDALVAFEDAADDEGWTSLAPGDTPFRREAIKTIAYELVEELGGSPDAVVLPVGHGLRPSGLFVGFGELASTGIIDAVPRLYGVQPTGCDPIVAAWQADESEPRPVEHPDTICGAVEVANPADGDLALSALADSNGGAVAVDDPTLLDAALRATEAGLPVGATGGLAVAGLERLVERGDISEDDTAIVLNPVAAHLEAEVLRSRLMSKGV